MSDLATHVEFSDSIGVVVRILSTFIDDDCGRCCIVGLIRRECYRTQTDRHDKCVYDFHGTFSDSRGVAFRRKMLSGHLSVSARSGVPSSESRSAFHFISDCLQFRTYSVCVSSLKFQTVVTVPPAPQQFFNRFSNAGKSVSSGVSPRITVITLIVFAFLRRQFRSLFVWRSPNWFQRRTGAFLIRAVAAITMWKMIKNCSGE